MHSLDPKKMTRVQFAIGTSLARGILELPGRFYAPITVETAYNVITYNDLLVVTT